MLFFQCIRCEPCQLAMVGECKGKISIIVARELTSIVDRQFISYTTLESIAFEANSACSTFSQNAFAGLSSLKDVGLPDSLEYINTYCFQDCSSIESMTFPSSLRRIYKYAFSGCLSLTTIVFPESGNIAIEYLAFQHAPLAPFVVEKSVVEINGVPTNSQTLSSISCPADHPHFLLVDGVLFSNDMSKLIMYPPGLNQQADYTVPDEVEIIGSNSFSYSSCDIFFGKQSEIDVFYSSCFAYWKGTSISFFDNCGLSTICQDAFSQAFYIKSFTITASLKTIETGAFAQSGIVEFKVAAGAPYIIQDGVLMSDENTISFVPPNITAFTIGRNITTIQQGAFARAAVQYVYVERGSRLVTIEKNAFESASLRHIDFDPNGPITYIDYKIFSGCPLVNFTFPLNVEGIDGTAFAYGGPTEFIVPPGHKYLAVVDGVLFNAALDTLVCYPPNRPNAHYVFPANVETTNKWSFYGSNKLALVSFAPQSKLTSFRHGTFEAVGKIDIDFANAKKLKTIPPYCFTHNSAIKQLRFPDSLEEIDYAAFLNNPNLVRVVFSENLRLLGTGAFQSCSQLTRIEFHPDCLLTEIKSACFSASPVADLLLPSRLQKVASNAFGGAVVILRFTSRPRTDVMLGFNEHTTLRYIYVPCECANWQPTVTFVAPTPQIIVYCGTKGLIQKIRFGRHLMSILCLAL